MFDLKKDLSLYKSDVHAEWTKAVSKFKSDGKNYKVPFILLLPTSGDKQVKFTLAIPGLSAEAMEARVVPTDGPYYASDLIAIMRDYPTLNFNGLIKGALVFRTVPMADVTSSLVNLSPDNMMKSILQNILKETTRRYVAKNIHEVVLLYALYGICLNKKTKRDAVSETRNGLQAGDFGLRDVAHAVKLLGIVNGGSMRGAATRLQLADIINRIDDLLAACGRPVTRPVPTGVFLRDICRHVKTSPLFGTSPGQKTAHKTPVKPTDIIPF